MSSNFGHNDSGVDDSSASGSLENVMINGGLNPSDGVATERQPAPSFNPSSDSSTNLDSFDAASAAAAKATGTTPIPSTASPARGGTSQQQWEQQHDPSQSAGRGGAGGTGGTPSEPETCLHVATTTWARDSHELFDYEARHVNKHSFFVNRAARAFRTALDVQLVVDGGPLPTQQADFLLSVRHSHGRYAVGPADKNIPPSAPIYPKKLWLIVKELPSGNHPLQENDVIKLGRFKLRVRQLVKAGATQPELRLDDVDPPASTVSAEDAASMQCRICLLDGGTVEDPLVCPCQCRGSIKFVHVDCLRHWINGRLSLPEDSSQPKTSFFFKQLFCELCKTPFPSAVMLNSERVQIVKVPKIDPPFVILENIVGAANRGLHVISMGAKKELKLGRGHESDVRIADVSISRYHATIRFSDGEFILEDHQSKFGTLVSLRKVQTVEKTCALVVQIGRTVMRMSLRKAPQPFEGVVSVCDEPVPATMGGDCDIGTGGDATTALQQQGVGSVPRPPSLTPLQQQHQQHLQHQLSALQNAAAAAAAANDLVFSGGQQHGGTQHPGGNTGPSEMEPWISRSFMMEPDIHSPWMERGAASMGPITGPLNSERGDAQPGGGNSNALHLMSARPGGPPYTMQGAHRSLSDYADSATSRPPPGSWAANLMHTAGSGGGAGNNSLSPWISPPQGVGSSGAPVGAVSSIMTGPSGGETHSPAGGLFSEAAAAAARLAPLGGLRSFFLAQGGGGGMAPSQATAGEAISPPSVGAPVAFAGSTRPLPAAIVNESGSNGTDNNAAAESSLPSS